MTAHKHAKLMAQYADDALLSETPWESWEYSMDTDIFQPCCKHPVWAPGTKYRRKKTCIFIGSNPIHKPLTKIEDGARVFGAAPHAESLHFPIIFRSIDHYANNLLEKGLLHEEKEDAIEHAEALLQFSKRKL